MNALTQPRPSTTKSTLSSVPYSLPSRPQSAITSEKECVYLEAFHDRKKTEAELQALLNRITLLRLEEDRTMTRIKDTKLRGKEILSIKKLKAEIEERRMENASYRNQMLEDSIRKIAKARQDQREKLSTSRRLVNEQRRCIVLETKAQEREIEEKVFVNKIKAENDNRLKAIEEKQRKDALRVKLQQDKQEKELRAQQEFIDKVLNEKKKRDEAESLLKTLEIEEADLISRLKRTKQLQEEAFHFLQKSLES